VTFCATHTGVTTAVIVNAQTSPMTAATALRLSRDGSVLD
jgi:hypothetical protein